MRDDDQMNAPGAGGDARLDEQALRNLLSGAVQGLEPAGDALERLRHAVPARRVRKRRALVGATAAVLLAGTAIPAALHMTSTASSTPDHSAMAGHGEQQSGPAGVSPDPEQNGYGGPHPKPTPPTAAPGTGGTGAPASPRPSSSPSGGASAGPSGTGASAGTTGAPHLPPVGAGHGVPGCTAAQLGVLGSARAPEADGKVYGSFKVTNVSARGCSVAGPDTVTAAPAAGPAAPPAQAVPVAVVGHTAGDPASGLLPDPSAEAPVMVLPPNAAYEVRFAWVPGAQSCTAAPDPVAKPVQGGTSLPPAIAAPDPAGSPASDPLTSGATGGGPSPAPAGVEVSHTPRVGAPTTQATIPAACGGTVYRTGVIPLPDPQP